MPVRERSGKWEVRFWVDGREYSEITVLAATERNRNAAQRIEAEMRRLVLSGRAAELRIRVVRFNDAAPQFLTWADSESREHPSTARRLRTSFASLCEFFRALPVSAITAGRIEDYKAWRRGEQQIREITLRHDLHALSKFFKYAIKHNWAAVNPVRSVSMPSDADAVRMHVLSQAEEMAYFGACLQPFRLKDKRGIEHHHGPFQDLHDVGRLILLQGCRPEEIYRLRREHIDLERGRMTIARGKSKAARRELRLTPESREILTRRLMDKRATVWAFASQHRTGQPICKLQGSHEAVLASTGLSFVVYDLRHTFATRAAERGMPMPALAAILGHSNLRSVHKYVHVAQAHMDDAMERFGVSLPGPCPVQGAKNGEETGKPGEAAGRCGSGWQSPVKSLNAKAISI